MKVHIHGPRFSTFVRSVMLCCEEKGVPYELGLEKENAAGQRLSDLHPFGKLPVLLHGERVIYETAPICRYLDNAFEGAALQSDDPYQRALEDQWTHAITCYIDKPIVRDYLLEFAFPKGEGGSLRKDVVLANTPAVRQSLATLESQLAEQSFICGEQFSIADALLIPMLDYLSGLPQGIDLFEESQNCLLYIERMRERASCRRVLAKEN